MSRAAREPLASRSFSFAAIPQDLDLNSLPLLRRAPERGIVVACVLSLASAAAGCDNIDTPATYVVLANEYPASAPVPLVVYQAYWEDTPFVTSTAPPIPPGSSSAP